MLLKVKKLKIVGGGLKTKIRMEPNIVMGLKNYSQGGIMMNFHHRCQKLITPLLPLHPKHPTWILIEQRIELLEFEE